MSEEKIVHDDTNEVTPVQGKTFHVFLRKRLDELDVKVAQLNF